MSQMMGNLINMVNKLRVPNMTLSKIITTAVLLTCAVFTQAKTTHNISLVSDYVYRGISQTDNSAAIQGGSAYKNGNAYASVWFSNVENVSGSEGLPVEMDVTFGYNNKFDGFNLDTSVITYNYLNDSTQDRTEFRFATSINKEIEIAIHREVKTKYWYPEIIFEKYLANRLYFDAAIGYWNADDADDSALTFRAEIARDFPEFNHIDIFIGVSHITDETPFGMNNDSDDDDTLFIVGIRKNF
jgi:uncharacterized protein (TIGR02001 family)